MLTNSDKNNIKNFERLKINQKRVFKHRLIRKFRDFQIDLEFVLLNYERLGIKADKIVDIIQLSKILDLYSDISTLQNM